VPPRSAAHLPQLHHCLSLTPSRREEAEKLIIFCYPCGLGGITVHSVKEMSTRPKLS